MTPRGAATALAGTSPASVAATLRDCAAELGLSRTDTDAERLSQPRLSYQVAVLGEHQAKAGVVNALLGMKLLYPYKGTGPSYIIRPGTPPSVSRAGGELLPLAPDVWLALEQLPDDTIVDIVADAPRLADDEMSVASLSLLTASLSNREHWLTLQACHAAIMVVDAHSQLTRHELNLLQEIARRAGPRLLGVVITGLDDVEESQRGDVVAAVRRRTSDLMAERDGVVCFDDPVAAEGLLQRVAAHRNGLRLLHGAKWAWVAALLVEAESLLALARDRRRTVAVSDGERDWAQRTVEGARGTRWQRWIEIRMQLRAAAARGADEETRAVAQAAAALSRSTVSAFAAADDKVAWTGASLAEELNRGLMAIADQSNRRLAAQLDRALGLVAPLEPLQPLAGLRAPDEPDPAPLVQAVLARLNRRDRMRLFIRAGAWIADAGITVGSFYGVPIQSVSSAVDSLAGGSADALARRSDREIATLLDEAVRTLTEAYVQAVLGSFRAAYDDFIGEINELLRRQARLEEEAWSRQTEKVEPDRIDPVIAELTSAIASLRSLT